MQRLMKQSVIPEETMYFTLGQAAKKMGVSKATISRDIKKGKLSAERQEDGSYKIQASELFRVYHPETPKEKQKTVTAERSVTHEEKLKINELETELKNAREKIKDLEQERDRWHTQAERLTLLITREQEKKDETDERIEEAVKELKQERDQWREKAEKAEKKKSWWAW